MPRLSLLSWMRCLTNRRPRRAIQPRRIAGIMTTRNYTGACSTFETLQALSDVVLVLDDNSSEPFPHRDDCDDYIFLQRRCRWNQPANLSLLLYRAFVHGCEWIVSLDDDIIPGSGLRYRHDIEAVIDHMESRRLDLYHCRLRDLWNSNAEYRTDGVWSRKTFPVVRRNWFFYDAISFQDPALRLHTATFPANLRKRWVMHADDVVYHTGCLTPEMRRERVEKYRREDPGNVFQADYEYMLDDRNLMLKPVPPGDLAIIREKHRIAAMPTGA